MQRPTVMTCARAFTWTKRMKALCLAVELCILGSMASPALAHSNGAAGTRRRASSPVNVDGEAVPSAPEVSSNKVVSDKLRLVYPAGLEGAGHHYLSSAFEKLFPELEEWPEDPNPCPATHSLWELGGHRLRDAAHYQVAVDDLTSAMLDLADLARDTDVEEGMLMLMGERREGNNLVSCGRGMLSYPNTGGPDKVMDYPDMTVAADIATRVGLDLRVVYLSRPARDMIISDTQHRGFATIGSSKENMFTTYMQIILTNAAVLNSMLEEIGPEFVTCLHYDRLDDPAHISEVANFISPTSALETKMTSAMSDSLVRKHTEDTSTLSEEEEVLVARLQRTLDALEKAHCGHGED